MVGEERLLCPPLAPVQTSRGSVLQQPSLREIALIDLLLSLQPAIIVIPWRLGQMFVSRPTSRWGGGGQVLFTVKTEEKWILLGQSFELSKMSSILFIVEVYYRF